MLYKPVSLTELTLTILNQAADFKEVLQRFEHEVVGDCGAQSLALRYLQATKENDHLRADCHEHVHIEADSRKRLTDFDIRVANQKNHLYDAPGALKACEAVDAFPVPLQMCIE